jgi:hypothetical protein
MADPEGGGRLSLAGWVLRVVETNGLDGVMAKHGLYVEYEVLLIAQPEGGYMALVPSLPELTSSPALTDGAPVARKWGGLPPAFHRRKRVSSLAHG